MDLTLMTENTARKNIERLDMFAKAGILYYNVKGGHRVSSGGGTYIFYVRDDDKLIRIAKTFVSASPLSNRDPFERRASFSNTRKQTYSFKVKNDNANDPLFQAPSTFVYKLSCELCNKGSQRLHYKLCENCWNNQI